jgi:hypothetical protein
MTMLIQPPAPAKGRDSGPRTKHENVDVATLNRCIYLHYRFDFAMIRRRMINTDGSVATSSVDRRAKEFMVAMGV